MPHLTPIAVAIIGVYLIVTHIPGTVVPWGVGLAVGIVVLVLALVDILIHGYRRA